MSAAPGLASASESASAHFDRGDTESCTEQVRRFLGVPTDEPTELTFFLEGRIHIAHALTLESHVRLLEEAERRPGFNGSYMLFNGPIAPAVFARYEPDKIHRGWNGRVPDEAITALRAVFIDCDPVRIKGIQATAAEKFDAMNVSLAVHEFIASSVGADAVGRGDSGNGFYSLIAIEPCAPTEETTSGIRNLLGLLNRKFGTDRVKIDCSVFNPARLMSAPGTLKAKGWNTPERPYRRTSFSCAPKPTRVGLEVLCGKPR